LLSNNTEFIWCGDDQFWSGKAPILFPIVGALKDGHMICDGNRYDMPRHGIARRCLFKAIEHTDSSVTMRLTADAESLAVYPWNYELQVHFELHESGIGIRYDVFNRDNTDMLFAVGSHPAFALEINDQYQFSDYEISFNQQESLAIHRLNEEGLLDTEAQPLSDNASATSGASMPGSAFALSEDIFNDDALVFRDIKSDRISLLRQGKLLLSVDTGGAPHLGIWAKPKAPFVCIEPWLGTSDFINSNGQFADKPDLHKLAPQQQFSHGITIHLPD